MGLEAHLHPDGLQYLLLGVCVFDMIFFSYYLFAFELQEKQTISDSLFTRVEYAAVLSITLTIRLTGAAMFYVRYRFQKDRSWLVAGFVGIILTFIGWLYLVLHKDNTEHFKGVFVFCLGSAVYSMALLRLAAMTHKHLEHIHTALEVFLLASSALLLLAFVGLWIMEETSGKHKSPPDGGDTQSAYIVEHLAYMTHLLFYGTFFSFHTPDPLKLPELYGTYEDEKGQDPAGVAMMPLLHGGM